LFVALRRAVVPSFWKHCVNSADGIWHRLSQSQVQRRDLHLLLNSQPVPTASSSSNNQAWRNPCPLFISPVLPTASSTKRCRGGGLKRPTMQTRFSGLETRQSSRGKTGGTGEGLETGSRFDSHQSNRHPKSRRTLPPSAWPVWVSGDVPMCPGILGQGTLRSACLRAKPWCWKTLVMTSGPVLSCLSVFAACPEDEAGAALRRG